MHNSDLTFLIQILYKPADDWLFVLGQCNSYFRSLQVQAWTHLIWSDLIWQTVEGGSIKHGVTFLSVHEHSLSSRDNWNDLIRNDLLIDTSTSIFICTLAYTSTITDTPLGWVLKVATDSCPHIRRYISKAKGRKLYIKTESEQSF